MKRWEVFWFYIFSLLGSTQVVATGLNCSESHTYYSYVTSACYHFSDTKISWTDAKKTCENYVFTSGGYLADIESQQESDYLVNIIQQYVGEDDFWIGLSYVSTAADWYWVGDNGNQNIVWEYWELNALGSHTCGLMKKSESYRWSDEDCNHNKRYICKTELKLTTTISISPETVSTIPTTLIQTVRSTNPSALAPTLSPISSGCFNTSALLDDPEMFRTLLDYAICEHEEDHLSQLQTVTRRMVESATYILNNDSSKLIRVLKAVDDFTTDISKMLHSGDIIIASTDYIQLEIVSHRMERHLTQWMFSEKTTSGTNNGKKSSDSNFVVVPLPFVQQNSSMVTTGISYKCNGTAVSDENISSDIISASLIHNDVVSSVPVSFSLKLMSGDEIYPDNDICAFLQFTNSYEGEWQTTGCELISHVGSRVNCQCNHTTNFALLLQVVPFQIDPIHGRILVLISEIGGSISLIFLVAALCIFLYISRTSSGSERMLIHQHLMVALFIAQFVCLLTNFISFHKVMCKVSAMVLHYAWTAVFCWMLIEGIQLYRQIVTVYGSEKSWMKYYYFIGWGLPICIVGVTGSINWQDYGAGNNCWLSATSGLIWIFVATVLVIVLVNSIILIRVVIVVYIASSNKDHGKNNVKATVRSALMLLPLLGLTWLFGIFAVNNDTIIFLYLFAICNSLQGVFVVVLHILLNSEVRSAVKRKQDIRAVEKGTLMIGASSNRASFNKSSANMSTSSSNYQDDNYIITSTPHIIVEDLMMSSVGSMTDATCDNPEKLTLNCPDNAVDGDSDRVTNNDQLKFI